MNVVGPAGDDARFVRWLLDDCQVPAANIRLHLSQIGDLPESLNNCGIKVLPAATDPIKHSLVHFPEEHPEAKMLILYWIGHGAYFHGRNDQALYLETATKQSLDCLETGELRNFLENKFWKATACPHRLVFIDACANQRKSDHTAGFDLPIQAKDREHKISEIKLCELRSASSGQFAHLENGSGYFSNTLLNWLKDCNANRLLNSLDDLIVCLEKALKTACQEDEHDQRPVLWQLGDWNGKTKAQRFPLEAMWMEDAERLLRGLPIANNQFGAIYRRICDRLNRNGSKKSLPEMIAELGETKPDKLGWPPLLEFVARVAESGLVAEAERESLRQLVECHLNGNQLATLRDLLQTERQQSQSSGERLLFDVMPSNEGADKEGADKFIFTAKRQTADGLAVPVADLPTKALTLAEIEPLVAGCIADSDQPFVEFSLPKELLSLEVDRWNYFGPAIGDMFSVVVRLRERSTGALPKQFLSNWRVVSAQIRQRIDAGLKHEIYWPKQVEQSPGKLMPHIRNNDYGVCVAFSAIPETRALEEMLLGGAPFAVWSRQSSDKAEKFKRAVNAKFSKNHFNRFPEEVRALRNTDNSMPDMTLLWDEPTQTPFEKFTPFD